MRGKILVCGAGSIGIFLGAMAHANNFPVHLFGRRKLKEAGDEEVYINNKRYKIPKRLFRMPKNEKYEIIFITSKLYDMPKIVALIKKNNVQSNLIVNIQNGIVDHSKFEEILHKKIIPVVVFGGFKIEKNKIASTPTKIGWITEYSREGKKVSKIISKWNIKCRAERKFDLYRAEKMIVNCCLNALSAIEKKPFHKLFRNKRLKARIDSLFEECYKVLNKEYPLENKGKIKKRIEENWRNVKHYSSTYQDLISGRKTEVNFFNGHIVNLGKKHNIDTKENKKILEDFKKIKNEV